MLRFPLRTSILFTLIVSVVVTMLTGPVWASSGSNFSTEPARPILSTQPRTAVGPFTSGVTPASVDANPRLAVSQLKVMNYYPAGSPWSQLWTNYNHAQVDSDFAQIASLGANAVRIIVQPNAVGWPTVSTTGAGEFADMVNTAWAHGLSVQLTLFDWWNGYSDVAHSIQWMKSLLAPYAGDNRIALVEVQNELTLSNGAAVSWAHQILQALPTVLPGVPRTVSVAGDETPAAMATMMAGFGADLDVVDVHLYGSENSVLSKLAAAQAAAKGRPVFVGEFGMPTPSDSTCANQAQASFYQRVSMDLVRAGILSGAPWTLNDFVNSSLPAQYAGTDQAWFGLRTTAGAWKPAATPVKTMFGYATTTTARAGYAAMNYSALTFDGGFECDLRAASDNTGKDAWTVFDPADAGHSGYAAGQGISGTSAGYLSNTLGNPRTKIPSLMHAFPVLSTRAVTVSAKGRLVGASGSTQLSIAWFNGSTYLGQKQSSVLSNTSTAWQTMTVTMAPPAGATSFQVHLKSYDNRGTAYFDGVSLSG